MHNITLKIEESYSLLVDELASGGYSWGYSIDNGHDVIDVTEKGRVTRDTVEPGGEMPNNFEAKREFIIKALKPGNAVARFFLRRQWETGKPPLKEEQLNIEVVSE